MDVQSVESFLSFIKSFIYYDNSRQPIGADGRIRVNYFIDLMSACHDPEICSLLAQRILEAWAEDIAAEKPDYVLAPKRGNILLARAVGTGLGIPTAAVRDSILFNRWIEGTAGPGCRAVLVDDVASDAELVLDCLRNSEKAGIFVSRVFALVDREEGDVARLCLDEGTEYTYLWRLSDVHLQRALGANRN